MQDKSNELLFYFGAQGSGSAYCDHMSELPHYFIDNDPKKIGKTLKGVEIRGPDFLLAKLKQIRKVIITSGYMKEILPQLIEMGIPSEKIISPPKQFLGPHPFKNTENKREAAEFLSKLTDEFSNLGKIVAVGGTALGFFRDRDFISWDFDIDLFAPENLIGPIEDYLVSEQVECFVDVDSILKGSIKFTSAAFVDFGIKPINTSQEYLFDEFEDYHWHWPIQMFAKPDEILIHQKRLLIPSDTEKYLSGVYGNTWNKPNPDFSYFDYGGNNAENRCA